MQPLAKEVCLAQGQPQQCPCLCPGQRHRATPCHLDSSEGGATTFVSGVPILLQFLDYLEECQCRRGVRVGQNKGFFWFSVTGCWLRSCQSPWVFYHSQMVGQEVPLGLSDGKLRLEVGLVTNEQTGSPGAQHWTCLSLTIRKITQ